MAGVFPYRGPGNPVPGPLAPLPDYMSEEKLQEKGERRTGTARAGSNVQADFISSLCRQVIRGVLISSIYTF